MAPAYLDGSTRWRNTSRFLGNRGIQKSTGPVAIPQGKGSQGIQVQQSTTLVVRTDKATSAGLHVVHGNPSASYL